MSVDDQLIAELAALRAEVEGLRDKVSSMESLQGQDVTRILLDVAADRRRLAALESRPFSAAPTGEKTAARIAKIDEVLKSRGTITLKQLEHILGIDRATMTRLLGKLDKRRYELHARPGDAREKVLCLRAQIR
jgi:hypothetical protein